MICHRVTGPDSWRYNIQSRRIGKPGSTVHVDPLSKHSDTLSDTVSKSAHSASKNSARRRSISIWRNPTIYTVSHNCDTFIRPRQKRKQQSSTIYKKYEKRKKLDQRNVREVPKQKFVNMPLGPWSAVPENPTLEQNMTWIRQPIAEISPLEIFPTWRWPPSWFFFQFYDLDWSSATSTSLRNCWQYFWLQDTLDNTEQSYSKNTTS